MPFISWTVTVNRKPEDVFAYLSDFSKHAEWSPKPYKVEALTDGPLHVGSRFRSEGYIPRDASHVNDVEITQLDPPSRLTFVADEPGKPEARITNDFVLSAADGGTKIDRTMDLPKPSGAIGLALPVLIKTVIKPGVQKGLDMLKTNLEKGA